MLHVEPQDQVEQSSSTQEGQVQPENSDSKIFTIIVELWLLLKNQSQTRASLLPIHMS